jgi:hypothetical protein
MTPVNSLDFPMRPNVFPKVRFFVDIHEFFFGGFKFEAQRA